MHRLILKLLRRRRLERDLEAELAFHDEMSGASGNPVGLGNRALVKEQARDVWRWSLLENVWRDLRHAARQLGRAPSFSLAAILTLALAIGANAAIFSVVYGVVLNPLPYRGSGRLVELDHSARLLNRPSGMGMKAGLYHYYGDRARTLDSLAIYRRSAVTLGGNPEPERVQAVRTAVPLASVLGVEPFLGRWFVDTEGEPGAERTAVLSHRLWTNRYGGDPAVLGRSVVIDGDPVTVVGIMGPAFRFPNARVDAWLPEELPRDAGLGIWLYDGVARLADGVSMADTRTELNALIADIPQAFPADPLAKSTSTAIGVMSTVRTLQEATVGNVDRALWTLLAAVGVVLLVACANVANLFLVRVESRQREVAIRSALGAGRAGIARLYMAESLLVSLAGAAIGLGLAGGGIRFLMSAAPVNLPRLEEIQIDGVVLVFAIGLGVLTALFLGSLPVFHAAPLASTLTEGGRPTTPGRQRHRARHLLMAGQVALALVLLTASGLMIRSFEKLRAVDPGFDPESALTFGIGLPDRDFPSRDAAIRAHHAIIDRIAVEPGVAAVSAATCLPLSGTGRCFGNGVVVEGRETELFEEIADTIDFWAVAGNYFETMGVRLIRGRGIERGDAERREAIAVVDERFADLVFPGEDPIGRRVSWSMPPEEPGQAPRHTWLSIVGVVGNIAERSGESTIPHLYMPMSMTGEFGAPPTEYIGPEVGTMSYVVRSEALPHGLLASIRNAVDTVDPGLAIANVRTLAERVDDASAQMAFTMILLAIAGSVALALGLVGIYGVVSYIVSQRTGEIGIRLALGAAPGRVSAMILRQGGLVTVAGIVVGLGAALGTSRLIESLLYGISPRDPLVFALTPVALFAVALLACWLPARRASRISPTDALRTD